MATRRSDLRIGGGRALRGQPKGVLGARRRILPRSAPISPRKAQNLLNFLHRVGLADSWAKRGSFAMSDLFLLSEAHMRRIERFFPLSHGIARVDDRGS